MSEANPDRKRWSDDPAAPSTDAVTAPADADAALRRRRAGKPRTGTPRVPRPAVAGPLPVNPGSAASADASDSTYTRPGTGFSADLDPITQAPASPAPMTPTPWSPTPMTQRPSSSDPGAASSESPAAPREAESPDGEQPSVLERARAGVVAAAAVAREKVAQVSTAATATAPAPAPVAAGMDRTATEAAPVRRPRRTRRARLRISRIDPWSVMKTSLLFGIAGGIIFVVATYVLMSVVEATGLFTAINSMVKDVLASPSDTTAFDITTYINTKRATGLAALIGAIDVVIFTALATVFSFLYNLSATMLGGLEITLAED